MLTTLIVTQVLFDVGILVLVVVSFHWLHERLKDGSQVDAVLRSEELSGLKNDIDRLATRLESKTEESLSRLEVRIEEARSRAGELERMSKRASDETRAAQALAERAEDAARRARELRAAPVADVRPAPAEPGTFESVYLLADEMTDVPEISKRTGLSQGEVEMILNLRSARAPRGQGSGGGLS